MGTLVFGKFQYREAKALLVQRGIERLIDGIHSFNTPSFSRRYWIIDGTPYIEEESHLEAPEDDYRLTPHV